MNIDNAIGIEIRNQHVFLKNLAETSYKGNNSEAILRELRKLWKILMDTEFVYLEPGAYESIRDIGGNPIGSMVSCDLRRVTAMERYFQTRGRGFLPYIGYHKGTLVVLGRQENLERIMMLYELVMNTSNRTLEGLGDK